MLQNKQNIKDELPCVICAGYLVSPVQLFCKPLLSMPEPPTYNKIIYHSPSQSLFLF